jgi:uroporphyrinogen decarboxylase
MPPNPGRERVLACLQHRQADRIPIDYWADPEVSARLREVLGSPDQESLLKALQVDLRYVSGPSAPGHRDEAGHLVDHWGVPRRTMTVEGVDRTGRSWSWSYQHVDRPPLETATSVREIEEHPYWPSAERWDYSGVRAACESARATGCAVVNGGDRLDRAAQLKPAMYLRGAEAFLSDLLLQPAMAQCLLEHVIHYYLDYNERVFRAATEGAAQLIDIFFMGDDMGTQTGPWVSPRLYRSFFKENFRRLNELAHGFGIKTMYHTCGNVTALIPDFIDCGLDILQSLQPAAMDLCKLKREFGQHLCFQGGIDIQTTMPQGTPAEVKVEVKQRAETLGPGGGYVFCTAHNLLPDVPTENLRALFEAYLEYGSY